jgi:hypothetical protein
MTETDIWIQGLQLPTREYSDVKNHKFISAIPVLLDFMAKFQNSVQQCGISVCLTEREKISNRAR